MVVRIDRVTTRGGDRGETSLGDGSRISKASAHIAALGSLDEANTVIGVLRAHVMNDNALGDRLSALQNMLFDLGSDLCQPQDNAKAQRVSISLAEDIDQEIDHLREKQEPLRSFILPGGSLPAAWAHMARASVRRAERDVVALSQSVEINGAIVSILNRLSDYFFVLARHLNDDGRNDTLWAPGRSLREASIPDT
ncbi:cob(I)yrinic acid a,c-diamide adenosyltransferase [Acetobacter sacchari]|uniref:Corrinoid adenosyltransferase n=1 Tax=Acetobacter sacchari TaxID=2661687 RepID=A0ABS3LRZ1_9PROT|nr:cob(I)yrinic acid a,c-diamide adenosyltransferase [Acetobacter sacchari]MBO1358678.1 cob(I)yrinic acid a,c-diamide adenosyltransferase [Acetobacter sacchari]